MMTFLRQWTLRLASFALTGLYTLYRVHPAVWRLMARNYRPWMGRFARLHAWMTCQFAALDVPAYARLPAPQRLGVPLVRPVVLPADRQAVYVQAYPEEQRCRRGRARDRRQRRRRVVGVVRAAVQLGPQPARAALGAQEPGRLHDAWSSRRSGGS